MIDKSNLSDEHKKLLEIYKKRNLMEELNFSAYYPTGKQDKQTEGYYKWLCLSAYMKIKELERPQGEWTPVSEGLPDDLEPVNITWINHEPEPYYKEIKDKPFTATGVYFNGQWYWWSTLCTDILAEYSHNYDDIIDTDIEVIAWQPLPEPYKKGGAKND